MNEHAFGGPWTEIKLSVLRDYLSFYTQALKNRDFKLMYIDAFAGSGECTINHNGNTKTLDGSAKIALKTSPAFEYVVLIEQDKKRNKALKQLSTLYPERKIYVYSVDANKRIVDLCEGANWSNVRAVMFLDPYGMEVKWETLQKIAATQAIDLWFLFSYSGLYRQVPKKMSALDKSKETILDSCLGTTEWRDAFYSKSKQAELFGEVETRRHATHPEMLKFVQARLKELFPYVADPLILPKAGGPPRYALFFMCSNPAPKAIGLSKKVANHILKKA